MDVTDYFRIVDVRNHLVHLQMRGFWSGAVVEQIREDTMRQFTEAARQASRKGPYVVFADLRELDVLTQEGRAFLGNAMRHAKKLGMCKSVEVITSPITQLSTHEAAESTGRDDFRILTKSFEEAQPIVDRLVQELADAQAPQPN